MGCGSSKATVVPQQPMKAWTPSAEDGGNLETCKSLGSAHTHTEAVRGSNFIKVEETKVSENSNKDHGLSSLSSSRDSIICPRTISASSTATKISAKSNDSGLGEDYAHVITEKSDEVKREHADLPEGIEVPDLTIHGEKMKTMGPQLHRMRSSGKLPPIRAQTSTTANGKAPAKPSSPILHKRNLQVDAGLSESSSIVKRPSSRGGMAYDLILGNEGSADKSLKRRPPGLRKLEKKRVSFTHEEIDEKQRSAQQRRKEHEQMMVERLRARQEKERQVAEALAKFAAMQMDVKSQMESRLKAASENREATNHDIRPSEEVNRIKKATPLAQLACAEETPVN